MDIYELIDKLRDRKMKPVQGFRYVVPRTCSTCAQGDYIGGGFSCFRPGGPELDVEDAQAHTCDLYQHPSKRSEKLRVALENASHPSASKWDDKR